MTGSGKPVVFFFFHNSEKRTELKNSHHCKHYKKLHTQEDLKQHCFCLLVTSQTPTTHVSKVRDHLLKNDACTSNRSVWHSGSSTSSPPHYLHPPPAFSCRSAPLHLDFHFAVTNEVTQAGFSRGRRRTGQSAPCKDATGLKDGGERVWKEKFLGGPAQAGRGSGEGGTLSLQVATAQGRCSSEH